jgi:hypothetical protein
MPPAIDGQLRDDLSGRDPPPSTPHSWLGPGALLWSLLWLPPLLQAATLNYPNCLAAEDSGALSHLARI